MAGTIDDAHISVRFKHGIHTIYMFVDTMDSMATVGRELRTLLRVRYPDGLTTSTGTTRVPDESENPRMGLGVLNVPNDPTRGWKQLKYDDKANAGQSGLKQNSIVAFAFIDEEDDEPMFAVEWPAEEEDVYEQA